MKPKKQGGTGFVGSVWKKFVGDYQPHAPAATHCAHCGEAFGAHGALGNLCANLRLHHRIEALEIELAAARAGVHIPEVAPAIDLLSEEIGPGFGAAQEDDEAAQ